MVSALGYIVPLQCVPVCVSDPLCSALNHLRCALVKTRKDGSCDLSRKEKVRGGTSGETCDS